MDERQQFNNDGMPVEPIPEGVVVPLPEAEPPKKRRRVPWNKCAVFFIVFGVIIWVAGFVVSGGRSGAVYFSLVDGFTTTTIGRTNETTNAFVSIENASDINVIQVNTTAINIVIDPPRRGDSQGVRFINVDPVDVTITDGTLTINTTGIERSVTNIGVGFHNRREIRVSLSGDFDEVIASTSSGSIRVLNTNAIHFHLQSTSGSIRMEDSNAANTLFANTLSGSIRFDEVSSDHFVASSTSGSVRGENINSMLGEFSTVSGSINLDEVSWRDLIARSTSGSIRISDAKIDPTGESTSLTSVSGSINIEVDGRSSDFSYDLSSASGSLRINDRRISGRNIQSGSGNHTINMRTTSGSIRLSFD